MPRAITFASLVLTLFVAGLQTNAAEPMIRLKLNGQALEGTPLAWNDQQVFFLLRDGQFVEFAPTEPKDFSRVAGSFKSYSQAEIRGQLLGEFGQGYEVSGVGHYLVVHPAGKKDQWAPRFEELYRSFVQYFASRGWQLTEPRFPLIAVIYPRQIDFLDQAQREEVAGARGLLGYYSSTTNRILLYDATAGQSGADWTTNAETIIHEAAHQSAFNTGVHNRFGVAPRWVVEGMGTLFEARGVWRSRTYPNQGDRINRLQLGTYRQFLATGRRRPDAIAELVGSDRAFVVNSATAYPEAWALTFFLSESEPKKYFQYLAKTAAVPAFSEYRAPQRLKDFTDVFGTDLKMLDARMQRFIAGLK